MLALLPDLAAFTRGQQVLPLDRKHCNAVAHSLDKRVDRVACRNCLQKLPAEIACEKFSAEIACG
jgi:hypothetical protein